MMSVSKHQHLVATTIWTLDLYSEERGIDDTNVVDYIALIHTGNLFYTFIANPLFQSGPCRHTAELWRDRQRTANSLEKHTTLSKDHARHRQLVGVSPSRVHRQTSGKFQQFF